MRPLDRRWPNRRWRGWLMALALLGAVGLAVGLRWERSDSWPIEQVIPSTANPLGFHPDGRSLDLSGAGTWIRTVDLDTGAERTVPITERVVRWWVSRDGQRRLELSFDATLSQRTLRVVATSTGAEVRRLVITSSTAIRFSPDGASVLIFEGPTSHAATVRTWDLATGAVTSRPLTAPPGLAPSASHLWVPSPDGQTLAYFDNARKGFQLWNAVTDQPLGSLLRVPGSQPTFDPSAWVFSPDGRFLLAGQDDGRVAVWDVARRAFDRYLPVRGLGTTTDLAFSPDGRTLAVSGLQPPRTLVARASWIVGDYLAPAANWRSTRETTLVEFPSGRRLIGARGVVMPQFSPDGRWVALREYDRVTIRPVPVGPPIGP